MRSLAAALATTAAALVLVFLSPLPAPQVLSLPSTPPPAVPPLVRTAPKLTSAVHHVQQPQHRQHRRPRTSQPLQFLPAAEGETALLRVPTSDPNVILLWHPSDTATATISERGATR